MWIPAAHLQEKDHAFGLGLQLPDLAFSIEQEDFFVLKCFKDLNFKDLKD